MSWGFELRGWLFDIRINFYSMIVNDSSCQQLASGCQVLSFHHQLFQELRGILFGAYKIGKCYLIQ